MSDARSFFSAAIVRASLMNLRASNTSGNAFLNIIDAHVLSIASWITTRIRGFWTVIITLFEPGAKIRLVSVGHVGGSKLCATTGWKRSLLLCCEKVVL